VSLERSDERLVADLLRSLNRCGPDELLAVLTAALGPAGVDGVRLYLADLEEERLDPWPEGSGAARPVSATSHGSAYRTGETQLAVGPGVMTAIAVVSVRRDRLGVLELTARGAAPQQLLSLAEDTATVIGYFIGSGERWTDAFHVARRTRTMTLPAEIQWSLLPLSTFVSDDLELSGALEPAYEVGGDAFDYSTGDGRTLVGLFDAMGHGLGAARLASLSVAAFRNARRRGDDLEAQARALHGTLAARFPMEGYVTGALLEIPTPSPSESRLIRAGHPGPVLIRGDPPTPREIAAPGGLPFGLPFPNELVATPIELLPGDRVVLYSDGVIEARPQGGSPFGLEALTDLLTATRSAPPREATRRIVREVRSHRDADLEDDATIVVVDIG
jgi:Stage II sporulation protein E (SpoIIE)